jgi:F-type H+-transporting ATPase subunit gamma
MKNLNKIKSRIKNIQQTMRITKAMDTISIAKRRKATAILENNEVYFNRILEAFDDLVKFTIEENIYLKPQESGKDAYIIVASDKGLCGSYNNTVLRWSDNYLKSIDNDKCKIYCIGQMTKDHYVKTSYDLGLDFVYNSNIANQKDAIKIADKINELYCSGQISRVNIIYTKYDQEGKCNPQFLQALPMVVKQQKSTFEDEEYFKELQYYPNIDRVLATIVRQYLIGIIYGSLVHSVVAEHTSRSMAMDGATTNSKRILVGINAKYNLAVQEQTTEDILLGRN